MMLTGAYEGFVVACHRHRDQAHGDRSGFCWKGEESMLVCFCLFLFGSKRERERERERETVPFFAIVEWYTLTIRYKSG